MVTSTLIGPLSLYIKIRCRPHPITSRCSFHISTQHLPTYLSPNAFIITSITTSLSESSRLHADLIKHGTILPIPSDSSPGAQLTVTTASLTPEQIANQHPYLSTKQKARLISLLRFWEMECERWRVLDEEEAAILREMEEEEEGMSGGARMDLGIQLRRNRMMKFMVPSQRVEGGDAGGE
ncbi:hypothetical protein GLAREA_10776 [Glarea lozoyensis ATCC 20868]|uniref:Uncharacterized protein n=1 Tax=Glarea lozoyensis (strain ATCC 20868 / MF5171) TaxID=1116229 RepID=S3DBF2_GLAL2|nr:uncharacterized protein GLAREA_10776 [Glarea lozoyensis ATCC 20868]EPE35080.1 hypothetical protein GLAREA_10776 [Glarea lozoyensis ATCC 20868]